MILVNNITAATDYAIMKQIQQIRLINPMDPRLSVVPLDPQPDLSKVGMDETLYVVSHGATGMFFGGYVGKDELVKYLTDSKLGVPMGFKGAIIILSCYGGDDLLGTSLAADVATGLKGRAATNTQVTGATGYSFGTPEFRQSGRSSVLVASEFYTLGNINGMVAKWLTLKPTHTKGVLHDDLKLNVATNKTIRELLKTIQPAKETPEKIATRYLADFAIKAKQIQDTLEDRLSKITVSTLVERADYLVTKGTEQIVKEWNEAIEQQYLLYSGLYLFATSNAFTTALVA